MKRHSATLIDNICTNSLGDKGLTVQCLIYSDFSDHFPINHIDYSFQGPEIDAVIVQRNMLRSAINKLFTMLFKIWTGKPCIFLEMHGNRLAGFTQLYSNCSINIFPNKLSNRNTKPGNGGCQNH